MKSKEKTGFDVSKEARWLGGVVPELRRGSCIKEMSTQVAEDVGLIQHRRKYKLVDGQIIDSDSGFNLVELTKNGGNEEEVKSLQKIAEGLEKNDGQTWVHFSPKDRSLGYDDNCVDFWMRSGPEVTWLRLVVKQGEGEMVKVRQTLSKAEAMGEPIRAMPVPTKGKLVDVLEMFDLASKRTEWEYSQIELITNQIVDEMIQVHGKEIYEDEEIIFRIYSAVNDYLAKNDAKEVMSSRAEVAVMKKDVLRHYATARITGSLTIKSHGCYAETMVGTFGAKAGYYVKDRMVVKGEIPSNYVHCKKCGVWYAKGETCPFCSGSSD